MDRQTDRQREEEEEEEKEGAFREKRRDCPWR
jgi:hypothetical protein